MTAHAIEHPAVCLSRADEHRCLLDPGHQHPTARRDDPHAPIVHVCVCWYRWTDTPTEPPCEDQTDTESKINPDNRRGHSLARALVTNPTPPGAPTRAHGRRCDVPTRMQ